MKKRWILCAMLPLATACGPSIVGDWEGECVIVTDNLRANYEVKLDIQDDSGGVLSGELMISAQGYFLDGDIEGTFDGSTVEIDFETTQDNQTYEMEIEATVEDNTLEGECTLLSGNIFFEGELELSKQD